MSDSNDPAAAGPADRLQSVDSSLTQRQRTILNVIRESVTSRGYPPSIREIGDAVGLTSTSSVAHQLRTLERKGYLRRDPNRPRAVDVRGADDGAPAAPVTEVAGSDTLPEPTFVPVLGRIAAGGPILAEEAVEDVFPLPASWSARARCFCSKWSATRWSRPRSATATGWWCDSRMSPTTATSSPRCSTAKRPSRRSSGPTARCG